MQSLQGVSYTQHWRETIAVDFYDVRERRQGANNCRPETAPAASGRMFYTYYIQIFQEPL